MYVETRIGLATKFWEVLFYFILQGICFVIRQNIVGFQGNSWVSTFAASAYCSDINVSN